MFKLLNSSLLIKAVADVLSNKCYSQSGTSILKSEYFIKSINRFLSFNGINYCNYTLQEINSEASRNVKSLLVKEVNKDVCKVSIDATEGSQLNKINRIFEEPDFEEIDAYAPEEKPSFNFASFVNKSHCLQELMKLGVKIYKWDKQKSACEYILKLDFESEVKPYIIFLLENGVQENDIGNWISAQPNLFKEDLCDLQVRINYLQSKTFSNDEIGRIITKNTKWLFYETTEIDSYLHFFKKYFLLSDFKVKALVILDSRIITTNLHHIKRMKFALYEEMGFSKDEIKLLLLSKPRILRSQGLSITRRFLVAHQEIGLTHETIVKFPGLLLCRDLKLKERHLFLKSIGRNQYDPCKPNYISPPVLYSGTDVEFCEKAAKTSVQAFNEFLKTL